MIATLDWHGTTLEVDFARGRPIAIPLNPEKPSPRFFTDRPPASRWLEQGDFIGYVSSGGSCNVQVIELIPHCHGTHTECVGHITEFRQEVQRTLSHLPTLCRLVSVAPENGTSELPPGPLREALAEGPPVEALVIRTLPNDPGKAIRDYSQGPAYPVPSREAMRCLTESALWHLLIDSPSLDPADDPRLTNHHYWWDLSDDFYAPSEVSAALRSITEMVFVPDDVPDGLWWLHLELSPIVGEATPSRPVLYPAKIGT